MEETLWHCKNIMKSYFIIGLNPCCNGRNSLTGYKWIFECNYIDVLILVVMEETLWPAISICTVQSIRSLNPCCNGRNSLTHPKCLCEYGLGCLNPCCNGRNSLTTLTPIEGEIFVRLNPCCNGRNSLTLYRLYYRGRINSLNPWDRKSVV